MALRLVSLRSAEAAGPREKSADRALARDAAMQYALRLLARRSRSEAEIRVSLLEAGTAKAILREVLGRLRELRYIDDRTFAAERSEKLSARGYGAERIRAELEQSGIDPKTIDGAVPGLREERSRARAALAERFGDLDALRGRRRAQAVRWLAGRGFREETIDEWNDFTND